ncbi:hypothetical protein [Vitiosangium sp. GDMCC 1.1324]|uniref:hypothetical protein n=1 Tax=Vitiosangium sp. (strain GDMCC 1.1324) TaxID=2138576 RepID=UPI000D384806|nr:hypothetical protein [Vitiosangium sp. GDMCC 1.1324]PTL82763.1 hypothetical protein DAT35_18530 [Vitiosangium sp. GDMCC 1.1324]
MDERVRAWSIVALSLLSVILIYVLVRTPPEVQKASAHAPVPQAQAVPGSPQASQPTGVSPDVYRGWPLFFGWPLPEVPSGSGGEGSGSGGSGAGTPVPPVPLKQEPPPAQGH